MSGYGFTQRNTSRPACGPSISPPDPQDDLEYEDCREYMAGMFDDGSRVTDGWLEANAERVLGAILAEHIGWGKPEDVMAIVERAAYDLWIEGRDLITEDVQDQLDREAADEAAEAAIERAA